MCKKNSALLWITFLLLLLGLVLALSPTSDCDNDGIFDSLITEGLLLFSLAAGVIEFSTGQNQIPAYGLMTPRILTHTFRHPPIFA